MSWLIDGWIDGGMDGWMVGLTVSYSPSLIHWPAESQNTERPSCKCTMQPKVPSMWTQRTSDSGLDICVNFLFHGQFGFSLPITPGLCLIWNCFAVISSVSNWKKKKSLSNIFDNVWGIFHKCCNCDSLGGAFLTLAPSAGWSADEGCSSSSTTVTISSWISESHNFGAGCLCSPKQQIQDQCVGLAERGGNALRLLRYMCLHVHLSFLE